MSYREDFAQKHGFIFTNDEWCTRFMRGEKLVILLQGTSWAAYDSSTRHHARWASGYAYSMEQALADAENMLLYYEA